MKALALVLLGCASLPAQREAITAEKLGEILAFLASDELAGRDTPSPGLERAAEWLAERFRAAGLEPGCGDGFFQRFSRPGAAIDRGKLRVAYRQDGAEHPLEPGRDVRLWRAGGGFELAETEVQRIEAGDPAAQALAWQLRGKKPVLLEVAEDSPLWLACAPAVRPVLDGRRRGGPPWLLVRQGLAPAEVDAWTIAVPAPAPRAIELRNVVAVLRGSERADEWVLLSAHYDHVGVGLPVGGDSIYNGADDDATGTAAVLAIARALAGRDVKPKRSVAFVCFCGEERGMLGSQAFAQAPPMALERIVADVNIEMLGRPWRERTAWITGRDLSDFEAVVAPALARAGIACERFPQAAGLFAASDNISLARLGVVAHSISASSLHQDYHQPTDEVERIDLDNMAAVVRGLYEVAVELACGEARPTWNDKGRERLGLDK